MMKSFSELGLPEPMGTSHNVLELWAMGIHKKYLPHLWEFANWKIDYDTNECENHFEVSPNPVT
jgi:hypothetical protein